MWLQDYLWCLSRIIEFLRDRLTASTQGGTSPFNAISRTLMDVADTIDPMARPAESALGAYRRADRLSVQLEALDAARTLLRHEQSAEETARRIMLWALWREISDDLFKRNAMILMRRCLGTSADNKTVNEFDGLIAISVAPRRTVPPDTLGALGLLVVGAMDARIGEWLRKLDVVVLDPYLDAREELAASLEGCTGAGKRHAVARELAVATYDTLAAGMHPQPKEVAQDVHRAIVPFIEHIA